MSCKDCEALGEQIAFMNEQLLKCRKETLKEVINYLMKEESFKIDAGGIRINEKKLIDWLEKEVQE